MLAARLRGCRWRGASCDELAMPASAARQFDPILRGSRLWWRELGLGSVLFTCAGFPERCTPAPLEADALRDVVRGLRDAVGLVRTTSRPERRSTSAARTEGSVSAAADRDVRRSVGELELAIDRHRVVWSAARTGRRSRRLLLRGRRPHRRVSGAAAHRERGRPAQSRDLRHARGLGGRSRRRDDDRGLRASLARSRARSQRGGGAPAADRGARPRPGRRPDRALGGVRGRHAARRARRGVHRPRRRHGRPELDARSGRRRAPTSSRSRAAPRAVSRPGRASGSTCESGRW